MSTEAVLTTIGSDVRSFFAKLTVDLSKARQAWLLISSAQMRSVLLAVGSDVVKLVKDTGAAVGSKGLALTVDAAVLCDIQQIIKDAEAGDELLMAELRALGVTL